MRVLILGANGMLGHSLCREFADELEVWATFRGDPREYERFGLVPADRSLGGVDADDPLSVAGALDRSRPDVVVNCIGIIKHRAEAKAAIPSIKINALFPHRLASECQARGMRMIHVSTDCVFSGTRGEYAESDWPDPRDLYGRTKLLGEVTGAGCLTLRTSIIGWEIEKRSGLLEWFAGQRHSTIAGYRKAIYSGLSTSALSAVIRKTLGMPSLSGLYHVASEPITKFDLLAGLRDALGWSDIIIQPDEEFTCDRSLVATRFEEEARWTPPSWESMIQGLAEQWPTYEAWRTPHD